MGYTGMNIAPAENSAHLDAIRAVAPHFGLSGDAASHCMENIAATITKRHEVKFAALGADAAFLRRVRQCFETQRRRVLA